MIYLWIAALLALILGLVLFWAGRRMRTATGLPAGEVIYSDTGMWEEVAEPLLSRRYGLVGRPDYLVRSGKEGRQSIIPVEVKSRRMPTQPLESHVLQLGAYCLLVEDHYKMRPTHGLIRYSDGTISIPFTQDLQSLVLETADAIRRARSAPNVRRQHHDAARCRRCPYRQACGPEALGETKIGHG